jgi:hypothetical protein
MAFERTASVQQLFSSRYVPKIECHGSQRLRCTRCCEKSGTRPMHGLLANTLSCPITFIYAPPRIPTGRVRLLPSHRPSTTGFVTGNLNSRKVMVMHRIDGNRIIGIGGCAHKKVIPISGITFETIRCDMDWSLRPVNGRTRENCTTSAGEQDLQQQLGGSLALPRSGEMFRHLSETLQNKCFGTVQRNLFDLVLPSCVVGDEDRTQAGGLGGVNVRAR